MEQVGKEQGYNNWNDESDIQENTTDILGNVNIWYGKMEPLENHVRKRSINLIFVLSTIQALDEINILFLRKSYENHCIKNKSIKDDYNFLC